MTKCKICEKIFDTEKAFRSHLRAHKTRVKDYYERFYPRTCLHTGRKLSWKDGDDFVSYSERRFVDKVALNQYFEAADNREFKQQILVDYLSAAHDRHSIIPSQVEWASLPLSPSLLVFEKYFKLYSFFIERNFKTRFDYTLDYKGCLPLQPVKPEEFTINVDSREQLPYRFFSTVRGKLGEGDYALAGSLFNGVVVERKSISDFGLTMTSGNERFRRELDRVRSHGKYLIMLVEYNIHDLYKHRFFGYSNPAYIAHCARGLIRDYSDCIQIVFGGARQSCVRYVAEFLLSGPEVKRWDLQYYVDSHDNVFKNDEFSRDDLERLYAHPS